MSEDSEKHREDVRWLKSALLGVLNPVLDCLACQSGAATVHALHISYEDARAMAERANLIGV